MNYLAGSSLTILNDFHGAVFEAHNIWRVWPRSCRGRCGKMPWRSWWDPARGPCIILYMPLWEDPVKILLTSSKRSLHGLAQVLMIRSLQAVLAWTCTDPCLKNLWGSCWNLPQKVLTWSAQASLRRSSEQVRDLVQVLVRKILWGSW